MKAEKLIYEAESYAIKGAAMQVYAVLGNGFLEAVYQECIELELRKRGIPFVAKPTLTLVYEGQSLKQTYQPDLVCYSKVIVELKAVTKLTSEHRAQVLNYCKATGFQLGLLFNFGHYPLLEQVRVPNIKDHR
ncbi:MAG: GxxExxY protein [Acidobacteria bacterium]|nr:GxxExxY protein [Acidobacteriota bacterium]MBI3421824.1 GxxExxY protein [Acidobacteriota bacterium]